MRHPTTDTDFRALHLFMAVFGGIPDELDGTRDSTKAIRGKQIAECRLTKTGSMVLVRQGRRKIERKITTVRTFPKARDEIMKEWNDGNG